jgi:glycyl-tRNA synthetase alpha chain
VSGELTYGLERIAMYLQDVDHFADIRYNAQITYGEMFRRSEWEWSTYNFEVADISHHLRVFDHAEGEIRRLLGRSEDPLKQLVLPAYDFVVKAAHAFNVLDARGAIGVTERQRYILRVRTLAREVCHAYYAQREALGFPLLKKTAAAAE